MLSWLKRLFRKSKPAVSIPEPVVESLFVDEMVELESVGEVFNFKSFSTPDPAEEARKAAEKRRKEFLEWRENCRQVDELFRRQYATVAQAA